MAGIVPRRISSETEQTIQLVKANQLVRTVAQVAPAQNYDYKENDYTGFGNVTIFPDDEPISPINFEAHKDTSNSAVYAGYLLSVWQPRGRVPALATVTYIDTGGIQDEKWETAFDTTRGTIRGTMDYLKVAIGRDVTAALTDPTGFSKRVLERI
jgi:hypothetical protein